MKDLVKIGEVAHICQIPISTLHYYDKIGLIVPDYIDNETNYRYYHKAQLTDITFAHYLKVVGVKLDDIKSFFEKKNADHFIDILGKRITKISETIDKLTKISKSMNATINLLKPVKNLDEKDKQFTQIKIKELPERRILFIKKELPPTYDSMLHLYCCLLSYTDKKNILIEDIIHYHHFEPFTVLRNPLIPLEVFYIIDHNISVDENYTRTLDSQTCISLYVKGNYEKIVKAYHKMTSWLQKKGFKPKFPITTNSLVYKPIVETDNMVIELLIPFE